MKKTVTRSNPRYDSLWAHANAGHLLAITPCSDIGDLMKSSKRLIDEQLGGWMGTGTSESGPEKFLVTMSKKDESDRFRAFLNRVEGDLGLSSIVAEGFDLALRIAVCREGESKCVVQHPFGLTPQISFSSPGEMHVSFESPPQVQPTAQEWPVRLQQAYAELRNFRSFVFQHEVE